MSVESIPLDHQKLGTIEQRRLVGHRRDGQLGADLQSGNSQTEEASKTSAGESSNLAGTSSGDAGGGGGAGARDATGGVGNRGGGRDGRGDVGVNRGGRDRGRVDRSRGSAVAC